MRSIPLSCARITATIGQTLGSAPTEGAFKTDAWKDARRKARLTTTQDGHHRKRTARFYSLNAAVCA